MSTKILLLSSAFLLSVSGSAFAAKCKIVGTWTDDYGATAIFKTNKRGTGTVPQLCSGTYKNTVTKLTKTDWDFTATAASCPTITVTLQFAAGSCTVASGTVEYSGSTVSDTFRKTAELPRSAASKNLGAGLR